VSKEALSWIAAMARRQPARAFQHENRMRYLVSYIFECRRRAAVPLEADLSLASSQQPERDSRYTAISGQPTAAR
jgi:hypothetical protein